MSLRITGKLPSGKHLEQLKHSSNYRNGAFQNLSPTPMKPDDISYWKMLKEFLKRHPEVKPKVKLPYTKTDLNHLTDEGPVLIWFGHSSYLLRINKTNFLIDPVLSGNAAPLSFMIKAFPGSDEYKPEDMPAIEYLILTHDHYDHLDYKTIKKLHKKINHIYCSLGISSHLRYWGVDEQKITEMDWWQTNKLENEMQLTAAPARHFSGRGVKRGQSLWSSFILKTPTYSIYLGGDSGYDTHFKQIGEKYGSFDLAILEAGQYNTMWPLIHMMPEQTVQAAADLQAKALLPVHWGKFSLAMHPWTEPINRVLAEAEKLKITVHSPMIGETYHFDKPFVSKMWWEISS